MPNLPDAVLWSIPAFVLLTVVEIVSVRLHPDEGAARYEAKDAVTSVGMGLGSLAFDFLWKIPIVAVYTALHALTPLRVPVLWWTVPLMLLAQDFLHYWSHHRVPQGGCLDRNLGGILIVRDRLFGSFVTETDRPVYGLTENIDTYNPLRVAIHEYVAIARDLKAAAGWRERAGWVLGGPGRQPARPAATTTPDTEPVT